jgi:16S rRNA pseudouridine516 synthase
MRLDRLVGKWAGTGKRRTREFFESGRVLLNGERVEKGTRLIGKFDHVVVDGEVLQARSPRYVMMHKPLGVVSATVDRDHQTVLDLIEEAWAGELHLAGRLDRFTSGLVILTNDSTYSESLTEPERKVGKRYLVTVDGEITTEVSLGFEAGIWFAKEEVMTAPALVEMVGANCCRLTIYEGKHHQVKRMFAQFDLKVIALHREAIGSLHLPDDLLPGEWRDFVPACSR